MNLSSGLFSTRQLQGTYRRIADKDFELPPVDFGMVRRTATEVVEFSEEDDAQIMGRRPIRHPNAGSVYRHLE